MTLDRSNLANTHVNPTFNWSVPMTQFKTHYDTLKVSHDAPPEVIRMAYKALVKKHHPDANHNSRESVRATQELNAAHEALLNPKRRRDHDMWIAAQMNSAQRSKAQTAKAPPAKTSVSPRTEPVNQTAEDHARKRTLHPPRDSTHNQLIALGGAVVVLFIVLAAQQTKPALAQRQTTDPRNSPAQPISSQQPSQYTNTHRVAYVVWDNKSFAVRADKAPTIRTQISEAMLFVERFIELQGQRHSLDAKLKKAWPINKAKIEQQIGEIDAELISTKSEGERKIAALMTQIEAAAP